MLNQKLIALCQNCGTTFKPEKVPLSCPKCGSGHITTEERIKTK